MSSVEREGDGQGLIEALAARGLTGELSSGEEQLVVRVQDCDETLLNHAIEDWIRERDLPLVPVRIGACTYALSPPAG